MGILDSLKDQALSMLSQKSPEMANALKGLIDQNGGLDGLVKNFQEKGFGEIAQSWVSTGANLPISADAIQKVIGNEQVKNLAAQFGVNADTVATQLATHLPSLIDKLTPNGKIQ